MNVTKKVPEFKIVFVGDTSVGKTSIIMRYQHNVFMNNFQSTVGAAFVNKTVTTEYGEASLQVWDTAGQERYRSLVPMYSRGATAALIVFDVSEPDSFISVPQWVEEVKKDIPPDCNLFVVGNKMDLNPNFDRTEAMSYCRENKLKVFFISAKNGDGVENLFNEVVLAIPETKFRIVVEETLIENNNEDKGGCC